MNDLISRQAAIDALNTAAENWNIAEPYHEGMRTGYRNAARIMLSLPSVQQEIIRCKDCKYNDLEEQNSTTRWLPCIDTAWPDNWFCGCAERRKDG